MSHFFRNLLARIALSPLYFREEWAVHINSHLPILAPAFHDSPRGRLLTLQILDDLHSRQPNARTKRRLDELKALCLPDGANPDKALYCFLLGLYHSLRDAQEDMARCFRHANKYGHDHHLPHAMLGIHYLYNRERYDDCIAEFNAAIDCICKHPPLDAPKRQVIANCHSAMACALIMMHRTREAEAMLNKASALPPNTEYHYASALLSALGGDRDETCRTLAKIKDRSESLWQRVEPGVQLILEGTHPHFTATAPDMEGIRAYWAWFASEERALRRLLADSSAACVTHQRPHFHPLCPEPANIDIIGVGFRLNGEQPELHFCAYYSRTYEALIDALIAACPPEISATWQITREP